MVAFKFFALAMVYYTQMHVCSFMLQLFLCMNWQLNYIGFVRIKRVVTLYIGYESVLDRMYVFCIGHHKCHVPGVLEAQSVFAIFY